jgi:hypothetical protein
MNLRSSISAATALSAMALAAAGPARALPDAESYEHISLIYGQSSNLSAAGPGAADVLNESSAPGCGAVCTAQVTLGANPSITLELDQVDVHGVLSGNFELAELAYFVSVNGPPAGTPVDVMLHASQAFSSQDFGDNIETAGGEAQVALFFGPSTTEPNFTLQGAGAAPYPDQYQDTYCISYCISSFANYKTPEAMPADVPLVMDSGTSYVVELVDELVANTNVSPNGNQLSASIDPTFTTTTPGVTFSYSAGVTSGVPEPATWEMLILGLAGAGSALRAARRRGTSPLPG